MSGVILFSSKVSVGEPSASSLATSSASSSALPVTQLQIDSMKEQIKQELMREMQQALMAGVNPEWMAVDATLTEEQFDV